MVAIAGILNVTPDSFSDGGEACDPQAAIAKGLALAAAGADWVDVGGESTRPGSCGVTAEEEIERVLPVVEGLVQAGVAVSIDTSKARVAEICLAAGALVVNDVGGLEAEGMLEVVASAGAGAVIMHRRGLPAAMQRDTRYGDLITELKSYLSGRLEVARSAGIDPLWIDPGIGFGKDASQNVEILSRLSEFQGLGAPIYLGASRKSFIGHLTGVESPQGRLAGSLGAAAAAVFGGASVLRVHDVSETRRMLQVLLASLPKDLESR